MLPTERADAVRIAADRRRKHLTQRDTERGPAQGVARLGCGDAKRMTHKAPSPRAEQRMTDQECDADGHRAHVNAYERG
jgi:hypothetical protein